MIGRRKETRVTQARTAIITAAGKGMGRAIAQSLAADGYELALMSNSGGAETLADELDCVGITGSVTEPDDLQRLVDLTMETYGRVDAVVNNTGHPPSGPLLELTDDDWLSGLDLVLLNVIRMTRLVTPIMERNDGGGIVNISTFSAFEPDPSFPISSSLRAALAGFTKLFVDQHASLGIRMNNILPGFIESYEVDDENLARIPTGRPGTVDEIAATASFLLSPEASYINGQNIRVDGGLARSV
ncbi:MAG: SDR family oxidoreductase [Acidimicrobiia bacterium]|nr:SDR family oxidoreductase [Acidimicrobiia bacterium]